MLSTFSTTRATGGLAGFLDRYFGISRGGSTIPTELRAGLTTFLTMAYILFVNPSVLGHAIKLPGAGNAVDLGPELLSTTALAAVFGTLMMALVARYPVAVAPGMGLNAYFAFTVVGAQGVPWQTALGGVFLSGVVFLVISVTRIREVIFSAIPLDLKHATAGGIGLFLAMIGCTNSGLIVAHPATLVTIGNLSAPPALVTLSGILITAALLTRKVPGAILIGILASTALAIISGAPVFQGQPFAGFKNGIVATPVLPANLFMALDISGAAKMGLAHIILTFTIIELFDAAGTLVGISGKAGMLDAQGNLKRATQVFAADASANVAGALLGTSPVTAYIESAAGIEEGGRTGLTALTVALLFLASMVFWPLAGVIPPHATAPALIVVGCMMMGSLARIEWHSLLTALPAFLTLAFMPMTYSISNGIAAGILSWCGIHVLAGKGRQVHWVMYLLAVALVMKFKN